MENIDQRLKAIESELQTLQQRNRRVEIDKAWERSRTRICALCIATWVIVSFVFFTIGIERYLVSAVVPTVGYYLSTRSLPFLKKWWIARLS